MYSEDIKELNYLISKTKRNSVIIRLNEIINYLKSKSTYNLIEFKEFAFNDLNDKVRFVINNKYNIENNSEYKVELEDFNFKLNIFDKNNHFKLYINNLYASINVEKYELEVKKENIVLTLYKNHNLKWNNFKDKPKIHNFENSKKNEEKVNSNPMDGLFDTVKLLYNSGGEDFKKQFAKSWARKEEEERKKLKN